MLCSIASSTNHQQSFEGVMDEALLDGGEAVGGRFVFFIEVVGYLIQIINDLRRKAVYCHTEFKYVITK